TFTTRYRHRHADLLYNTPSVSSFTRPVRTSHSHSFPTRRSSDLGRRRAKPAERAGEGRERPHQASERAGSCHGASLSRANRRLRSEEHTSELQSRRDLVCRLLLEKKKIKSHNAEKPTRMMQLRGD